MLSIIIPAYNEGERLDQTLNILKDYIDQGEGRYEIVVIDDGSTDNTLNILKSYDVSIIENNINRGKGYSVKRGMLSAKSNIMIFMDADLSTPLSEIDEFVKYIGEYDVVIGIRVPGKKEVSRPPIRRIYALIFNKIVRVITGLRVSDTQCGFKMFSRGAARSLFAKQTINRYGFDVEILYLANKLGFRIKEVPVPYRDQEASKISLITEPIKMTLDLLKIRINDFRGRYEEKVKGVRC